MSSLILSKEIKKAAYLQLSKNELKNRVRLAYRKLKSCGICPRYCKVDRLVGEVGICQSGKSPAVSSYGPHFGEEKPLVGKYGSGTIFFTSCNLKCIFCQNYSISYMNKGYEISVEELAQIMLKVQEHKCHNLNLVTPTHFVPQILAALYFAVDNGLKIPIVYNSGGYESVETLKLLDGIVDIYMPDIKYGGGDASLHLSRAKDYAEASKAAVREMHRQTGDLILDNRRIAVRGLLVRHLILPDGLAHTKDVMNFIADEVSKNTYVNLMNQYYPCFEAQSVPSLNRRITSAEFEEAETVAKEAGLERLDHQLF